MTPERGHQKRKGRVAARRIAAVSAIAALVSALASCSNSPTGSTSKNNGISIAPDSASVSIGASVTLTAGLATGGPPPTSFFWSSSDTAVAVVSQIGVVSGRGAGSAQIAASADGASGVATIVVVPQGAGSIVVVPAAATLRVNSTLQLSDTVKDSAGKALGGRTTSWATDNANIASVDAAGLVVAHAVGTAHITASSGAATGSSTISVTLVPVASVSVEPRDPTVQAGQTTQLTAIPLDSAGNPLAGIAISWQSANSDLATVSTNGLVTGVAAGTAIIQAAAGTKTGIDSVLVTEVPIGNVSLSLATSVLLVGQTEQLSVQVTDADGHPVKDPNVKFSTSDPTIATVSNNGLVTAIGPGTATITGTSRGKSGTVTVQVMLVPVASVVVTPPADTLAPGQQATLQAAVLDSVGDPLPGRVVVWSSSNTGVATIDGNGKVTAVAQGTAVMTAASGGKSGAAAVTVTPVPVASVSVTPAVDTVPQNEQVQLTATLTDAGGNVLTGRPVSWQSSNSQVAAVDGAGLVTAVSIGTATITATAESVQGSATVVVTFFGGGRSTGTQ